MALLPCDTTVNTQGKELVEHGTALFPIACYHDELAKSPVPWHWHDELEALIVIKGQALVAVGKERFMVKAGEGVFINAGVLHGAWDRGESATEFHSLVFHPRLVGGSMDSIFWQNYLSPLLNSSGLKYIHFKAVENELRKEPTGCGGDEPSSETVSCDWHASALEKIEAAWQSCVREPAGYEFQVREALSGLIFLVSGICAEKKARLSGKVIRDGERIKRMLEFIHSHYAEELGIKEIADSASVSTSEALRCFHSTIGTSPMKYVKQFRIQKAAQLLTSTGQKIGDIGALCGFQDMSYFTKIFREMKGCTPGEYRRRENGVAFLE